MVDRGVRAVTAGVWPSGATSPPKCVSDRAARYFGRRGDANVAMAI